MVMTLLASLRGSRSVEAVLDAYAKQQAKIRQTLKRDLVDIIDDRKLTVEACNVVLEETKLELISAESDIDIATNKLKELN